MFLVSYFQIFFRLLSFVSAGQTVLYSATMANWTIELSKEWDVLGPFPISAREQHFLSPCFPLNLSVPYQHQPDGNWSSAYADGGKVGWSKFSSTDDGHISISFPNIRWNTLRATEGWAALQHHNTLHTTLKINPPSAKGPPLPPLLAFSLTRGSFFTLVPRHTSSNEFSTPEWHAGNIYEIPRAPKQLVDLPNLSLTEPTTYDLFVSGDYEIRLFGDPLVTGRFVPVLDIDFSITLQAQTSPVELDPALDVSCDFVDGWAFGTALGVGLRATSGVWDVLDVSTSQDVPLSFSLLYKQRLVPTQSRIVPVKLTQDAMRPFHEDTIMLHVEIFNAAESKHLNVTTSLKIRHRQLWGSDGYEALRATYFLSGTPTLYLALPPLNSNVALPRPPIIALHGAGVEVEDAFWSASLPRLPHSWIICPAGRTSWGFDWHGPSADDVWGSLAALTLLLTTEARWEAWKISESTQIVILGHSNGGQGTWYLASKYPDRVLAAVPAAAYIKPQQYIPLSMSRGYHFIDPSLRAILDASLAPDDNDLFLSNVADIKILAIHGGVDENVPTWHSRQLVDVVTSWTPSADISLLEDTGKPHWYPEVFASVRVQDFLASVLDSSAVMSATDKSYTLTVAVPHDSGSMHGLRIEELEIPGRLGRLHVTEHGGSVRVKTTNVHTFSINLNHRVGSFSIDDQDISLHVQSSSAWLQRAEDSWKVLSEFPKIRPLGSLSQITRSTSPLLIIIPAGNRHSQSIGLRVAHVMLLNFRLDAEIITDVEAFQKDDTDLALRNLVIIGSNNAFGKKMLRDGPGLVVPTETGFSVHGQKFDETSLGLLFLHPHPATIGLVSLFLWGTDESGLERVARLILPIRTGVTLPEFILSGRQADTRGIGGLRGAGFWNRTWGWSDGMSWLE